MKKSMGIEFFIAILKTRSKNWKTVNQIIEKEHLDKNEYEAEPPLFFFSGSLD